MKSKLQHLNTSYTHCGKSESVLFSKQKRKNLLKNIQTFTWAKEKAAQIIADANDYLQFGADKLAELVTAPNLKRSSDVNQEHGCPLCGKAMLRFGVYGWIIDYQNDPWKVKCPSCGARFPSNDFEKFYTSGLDVHGYFSYERADRRLLKNELYPDEGPDFAVDDGTGFLSNPDDPQGENYTFIAFYILHSIWMYEESTVQRQSLINGLRKLTQAYQITGQRCYGEPAAMLLEKIAELWPQMHAEDCQWSQGYKLSHGLTGKGRILGCIWDTLLAGELVDWYDALLPCFNDSLADYIARSPVRYWSHAPKSGLEISSSIEQNLLLQFFPDYTSYTLDCNPGPAHLLLLKTARVLKRDDLFEQYADYLFNFIDITRCNERRLDLQTLMISALDWDGFAGEGAVGYNNMWAKGFIQLAQLLYGTSYDLFQYPKFRKMGNMAYQYVVSDHFTLSIGDSGRTGSPVLRFDSETQIPFFLITGDIKNAQFLVHTSSDGMICKDWYMDCAAIDSKICETVARAGEFHSQSRCLAGVGLAVIESHPLNREPESNALFFGRNDAHGHRDTLNLMVHGFGIDMMPDLGYPDFANVNPERYRWSSNMIAHNTVTIPKGRIPQGTDEQMLLNFGCRSIRSGQMRHFYSNGTVSVIDVEATELYQTTFRRICVTVDLDGDSRYLVDWFSVDAPCSYLSYHAAGTQVECTNAEFYQQDSGSYAGAEIPYADINYSRCNCSGFNYLTKVRRGHPRSKFSVDWKCEDFWKVWQFPRNVHLKVHVLSDVNEAALCAGSPPQTYPENPREMTWLILEKGKREKAFATVLEPYENTSFLADAMSFRQGNAQVFQIVRKDKSKDCIIINPCRESVRLRDGDFEIASSGFLSVFHMSDKEVQRVLVFGETVFCGSVVDFTRTLQLENMIYVRMDQNLDPRVIEGCYADVYPSPNEHAFFRICKVEQRIDGIYVLHIGDCSLITGFKDRQHKHLGYRYCIFPGARVKISV